MRCFLQSSFQKKNRRKGQSRLEKNGKASLIRHTAMQWNSILKLVGLEYGMKSEYPQDIHAIGRFEPRIEYIAKQIRLLWSSVPKYKKATSRHPSAFHLKNISDWVVNTDEDPSMLFPYVSVLQYLSHPCGLRCQCCLHKNDPPGLWTKSQRWKRSTQEAITRLKFLDPTKGRVLFKTQDYAFFEITNHPDFLPIADKVRAKTEDLIFFTTNALGFDDDFVSRLSALKPIFLMVSLYPENRNSLKLLQKERIPFAVSIVPENESQLAELPETIRFAENADAYFIRITFPGFSRFFPKSPFGPAEARGFWRNIVLKIKEIIGQLQVPILFQPSHFDMGILSPISVAAFVSGVVKNSPAYQAGLRFGDVIAAIDRVQIRSRVEAIEALALYRDLKIDQFDITVIRQNKRIKCNVAEDFGQASHSSRYPYFPCFCREGNRSDISYPYGIVFQHTFDSMWIFHIQRRIIENRARNVFLVTSELLHPLVRNMLDESQFSKKMNARIRLVVPKQNHFLGGDLLPGDLLVVEDIIACIKEQDTKPDLIMIPRTIFSNWGRDISNRVYHEIERVIGTRVELVPCQHITTI